MGDHVRRQVENQSPLSSDALTAEHNRDVQHWLFEQENDRNRERGYSDEAIHQMKLDAEAEERRQDRLNEIAWKHRVADPTIENIRQAILKEQKFDRTVFNKAMARDAELTMVISGLEIVDKTCETAVYAMASSTPWGPLAKDIYTFAKAVGVAGVEAKVDGKGWSHVGRGVVKGAIRVAQHHVGDYYNKLPASTPQETIKAALKGTLAPKTGLHFDQELENFAMEGLVWSGLEAPIGGITAYEKGSSAPGVIGNAAWSSAKKITAYGISKFTGACISPDATFKIPGVEGLVKAKGFGSVVVSKTVMNTYANIESGYNFYKAWNQYSHYSNEKEEW